MELMTKHKRRCKGCHEWAFLTPKQLEKWTGTHGRACKRKFNQNDTKWLIKACDKAFSELIRSKGACEKCLRTDTKLDCAHVIPRTNKTLRWDINNALSLCFRCHTRWAHQNPLEFASWFRIFYRERYLYLMTHKNTLTKRTTEDYQNLLKALKEKDLKKLSKERILG